MEVNEALGLLAYAIVAFAVLAVLMTLFDGIDHRNIQSKSQSQCKSTSQCETQTQSEEQGNADHQR